MVSRITMATVLSLSFLTVAAQPCTINDATNCDCLNGTGECDLLPDIIVGRDLLLDPTANTEYPQTGAGQNNGRLRISVSTPNIGHGPLEVDTTPYYVCGHDTFPGPVQQGFTCPDGTTPRTIISQRVYHKNGSTMTYFDRPAGTMTHHPTHGHRHVDDWGVYTLRLRDSNETDPLKWPIIADGAKLAFCLMDYGSCSYYSDTANNMGHCRDAQDNILMNGDFNNWGLGGGAYNCSPNDQGISVGWTDVYYQYLDGMWANIPPGTCNGEYYIVVQLDPYDYFLEENEDNNVAAVPFELMLQVPTGTTPHASIGVSGNFVVDDTVRVCSGETVTLVASPGYSYAWSTGAATRSTDALTPGTYSVTVDAPCGTASASVVVIVDGGNVTPPIAVGDTLCEGESAQLVVTSGGDIGWYDAVTGGNLLYSGTSFTTGALTATTTFYAEAQDLLPGRTAHVGPADSSIGNGSYITGTYALLFDVDQAVTLKSVKVHSGGNSNRLIQLRDKFGVVLHDTLIYITQGEHRAELDFPLTPGKDYQLGVQTGSSPNLWRSTSGVSYPYALEGAVTITGSSLSNNQYYYFYDWELQLGEQVCGSARTAVVAQVNPLPAVSFSGLDTSYSPSQSAVTLTGTPSGGMFSGPGVYANTFDPGVAGVGDHDIIYAYIDNNNCSNSETQTTHVAWGVGVSDPATSARLKVVPNIGDGRFEVEFGAPSGNAVLQVFDAAGRVIELKSNLGNHFTESFDLRPAGAGVYTLCVTWDGGEVRERVVVAE